MSQHRPPGKLIAFQDQFVTVAGEVAAVSVEEDSDPRKIDHVWITVRAGEFGRLQISLSTTSRQAFAAGFDPRVQMAVITSAWTELPPPGVRPAAPFDYSALGPLEFVPHERVALEQLLVAKARRAVSVEAWGEFYLRSHSGIHQVHSRRASFAIARDIVGQDGAIRFYHRTPQVCETVLLKFAGQA